MGAQPHSFSSFYATQLYRYVALLSGRDPTVKVSKRLEIDDLEDLVKNIYQVTHSLGFGLALGKNIHPSDLGLSGYALMNCFNLADAMQKLVKYRQLLHSGFETEFHYQRDAVVCTLRNQSDRICLFPLIEFDLASGLQFARLLAGPALSSQIRVKKVELQHPPLQSESVYRDHFQCEVKFECAQNAIFMDRESLRIPVHGASARLFDVLDEELENSALSLARNGGLKYRVKDYLQAHVKGTIPDQSQTAEHFNMSVSCLKTNLRKHGTSFQKIADEVRYNEAKRLLKQPEKCLKEISFRLGFANQSAFNRAFKRWSDTNPGEYRLRQNNSDELLLMPSK